MNKIGSFAAKMHLSALLERVEHGEEIVITRRGKAVARLVPAATVDRDRVQRAIDDLKRLRRGSSLGGSWKALRDDGRR